MTERILVFRREIPMRWGDMDAMGHVNNTVYFRYLEETRISWFDALGFPPEPAGEGPVIVNAHCTFVRQLEYPGTVVCEHSVGAIGRSSFETHVTMRRADDPHTVYAEGGAKVVWVYQPEKKSRPLPDRVRRAIVTPLIG